MGTRDSFSDKQNPVDGASGVPLMENVGGPFLLDLEHIDHRCCVCFIAAWYDCSFISPIRLMLIKFERTPENIRPSSLNIS